jgi:hypothetical protein
VSTKRVLGALLVGVVAVTGCTGQSGRPTVGPTDSTSTPPPTAASPTTGASPTGAGSPTMSHDMSPSPSAGQPSPSGAASDVMSPAANLRTDLNYLLGEHLILAAKATGAALGGRQDEFAAAGSALNTNGTDIGAAIGSIYGAEAEDEFNRIWSAHNGFFVDYTTGVAMENEEMADQAVSDLTTIYVPEFSAFLAGATGLPEDALAEGITEHVLTTKAIVDAQADGDAAAAAEADRAAGMHMRMLGDTLAPAIVEAQPESFR